MPFLSSSRGPSRFVKTDRSYPFATYLSLGQKTKEEWDALQLEQENSYK